MVVVDRSLSPLLLWGWFCSIPEWLSWRVFGSLSVSGSALCLLCFQRLHSSPLQFASKENGRSQVVVKNGIENESSYETEDDEDDGLKRKRGNAGPSRKKIRTSRHQGISDHVIANGEGYHKIYDLDSISLLTYSHVKRELDEEPTNPGRAKCWNFETIERLFRFLFLLEYKRKKKDPLEVFDRTLQSAQGWKDLTYLQAMMEIKSALADSESDHVKEVYGMFLECLKSLFCMYGRCILNPCRDRWLARTKVQGVENPAWLCLTRKAIESKSTRI